MDLSPAQIEKEWSTGKYRPVYYFIGEDSSAKSSVAQKLKDALKPDAFNLSEFGADGSERVDEIVSTALTPPMFSDRRLVLVKTPKLNVEAKKKLAGYLADPLETTTLVLFCDDKKPDVRDVLTAAAAAQSGIVVFKPLTDAEAVSRLEETARNEGFSMESDAADLLVSEAGTDWTILSAELKKALLYTREKKKIGREDILACLGYKQAQNPFEFAQILQGRDMTASLKSMRRSFKDGSDAFGLLYQIIGMLNKQLKAKRLVKAGIPEASIFGQLRISPWHNKDYLRQVAKISEVQLVGGLKACARTETNLKSKTWLDPTMELERLVARICGN